MSTIGGKIGKTVNSINPQIDRHGTFKGYIINDGSGKTLYFQLNPQELILNESADWTGISSPWADSPRQHFVGGGEKSITLEIMLDAYSYGSSINTQIQFLREFMPSKKERRIYPPTATFGFGSEIFTCILKDFSVTYTNFSQNLEPLRANVSIALTIL